MNKNTIFEYLKTIAITLLSAFVVVMGVVGFIQHQIYSGQIQSAKEDDAIDYYLIGVLIEKNKYLEKENPKNYNINLKLGILYEIKRDFANSELEYKKAMQKAPFGEVKPAYKLARLYLRLDRLEDAQAVVDSQKERPGKKFVEYKAEIYNRLGDKYYDKADYETAAWEYQKALFYYNIINAKQTQDVKNSLASSFVYLAEEKIQKLQIDEAINSLEMALTVVNAPILKYKLALLLIKSDPERSDKYFLEVFNEEPSLINYQEYMAFLSMMSDRALEAGDIGKSKLYEYKIKKLTEYYKSNILSVEDVIVEDIFGKITLNNWQKKYHINLKLTLRNTSGYNMNALYVEIVLKDGNKTIDTYSQEIADKISPIKLDSNSPIINIRTTEAKTSEDTFPKRITAQVYAAKTAKSYKLLLKEIEIIEQPRKKK